MLNVSIKMTHFLQNIPTLNFSPARKVVLRKLQATTSAVSYGQRGHVIIVCKMYIIFSFLITTNTSNVLSG